MLREHTIETKERGETQDHINICRNCTLPASKCNGECERYKKEAKKLRNKTRIKKNIVIY